ncbi:MAG TPA: Hsp20/alpha crystallin family protein [Gemmatimonadales bacterium]|nr:Hsp20/alpha crystallin family protein [Gemmatimonadales bacterium]
MAKPREEGRTGGTAVQERTDQRDTAMAGEGNGSSRTEPGRALSRWPAALLAGSPASPWELMRRMSEEMDQLFESLGGRRATPAGRQRGGMELGTAAPLLVPHIEVQQRGNELVVKADLPGLRAEDINVAVDRGVLTISGERRQEEREEREGFIRSEVSYGTFYRTIPLPDGADEERVAATFRNGVLEVTIPVSERQQGRRIQVKS